MILRTRGRDKGFYENRVWTMVELFGFTSNYAMEVSAAWSRKRYLIEVAWGYSSEDRLVTKLHPNGIPMTGAIGMQSSQ